MNTNLNKAIEILKKNKQEHIIPFLDNGKNDKLVNQVLNINFEKIKDLYNSTKTEKYIEIENLQPIIALNPSKLSQDEINKLKQIGIDIVKNGKFAVSTMAGRTGYKTTDTQNLKEHLNLI